MTHEADFAELGTVRFENAPSIRRSRPSAIWNRIWRATLAGRCHEMGKVRFQIAPSWAMRATSRCFAESGSVRF